MDLVFTIKFESKAKQLFIDTPKSEQVALLIKPSASQTSKAASTSTKEALAIS